MERYNTDIANFPCSRFTGYSVKAKNIVACLVQRGSFRFIHFSARSAEYFKLNDLSVQYSVADEYLSIKIKLLRTAIKQLFVTIITL